MTSILLFKLLVSIGSNVDTHFAKVGQAGRGFFSQTNSVRSTATPSVAIPPFVVLSSTSISSLTPSMVPTHLLERLKDKLPSVTPAYGFVVLEMPKIVNWDDMITVTILTVPASGSDMPAILPKRSGYLGINIWPR